MKENAIAAGFLVTASVVAALLLHPTRSRLKELGAIPPVDHEPSWIGSEISDLGHWLKAVFSSGGSIVLAAIAGALFASAKRSRDVIDSLQVLLWALALGAGAMLVVWSIRFGIRIKRIADTHPELGLPSYSTANSAFLAGFAGFCAASAATILVGGLG